MRGLRFCCRGSDGKDGRERPRSFRRGDSPARRRGSADAQLRDDRSGRSGLHRAYRRVSHRSDRMDGGSVTVPSPACPSCGTSRHDVWILAEIRRVATGDDFSDDVLGAVTRALLADEVQREVDGTPSNAKCECGHQARVHVMPSQRQRCEGTVYTNAPLGGGSAYPCPCRQFEAAK